MNVNVSRRDLLKGSGALVVSFSLAPVGDALAQGAAATKPVALTELDSFLAIDQRGQVLVYSGKVDLGTGVSTALRQIVAEELDVPFSRVALLQGDSQLTPDQGKTWGSLTIQVGGMQLRNAAATARSGVGKVAITASPIVLTTAPASVATISLRIWKCALTRSKAARSPTLS